MNKKNFMSLLFIMMVAMLSIGLTSCGDDEETIITESEIVGTWVLSNSNESPIFDFHNDKSYYTINGKDIRSGTWVLSGNTISCQSKNFNESIKITEYQNREGKAKYQNSEGKKCDFKIEKADDRNLFKTRFVP